MQDLSTELGEGANGIMNVFDRENEMVFRLAAGGGLGSVGQNYLEARKDLVKALLQQAVAPMTHENPVSHWDRLAAELALEHCKDMLHLLIFGLGSIVGMLVAAGLFSLPLSKKLANHQP